MALNGETILAVIPARGGSKRAPRKNVRLFRGQPLVAWSVQAARASTLIDDLVISTEDREIKDIGLLLNVAVLDRPQELATDDASAEDVLRHALQHVRRHDRLSSPTLDSFDWVVLLQPTSPLRTAEDIDACIRKAFSNGSAALTVNEMGHKNGAVYVASKEWIAEHDFSHAGYAKHVMPDSRSLDIDYPEQLSL
jgi:CMP-N-acetylneuraminic acid synthetase